MFAIALGICAFRWPSALRVYRAALFSPPIALFVLFVLITSLSTLFSVESSSWSDALPKRLFMVPLLVLPVLHRWRLLLAGLAVGACASAVISLGRLTARVMADTDAPIEITDGSAWVLTVGVVAGIAALAAANTRVRLSVRLMGVALGLGTLLTQCLMTQRAPVVGSLAALALLLLLMWRALTRRTRVVALVAVPLLALIGFFASANLGGAVAKSMHQRSNSERHGYGLYDTVNYLSSSRLELWSLTLDSIIERPVFGHGKLAWRTDIPSRIAQAPERTIAMQSILDDPRVHYSHNSELDVLYTSGFAGFACLLAAGILGARAAQRRLRDEPLAMISIASLVGVLASSQFDFVFARAIPGALLVILACIVLVPRPSSSEWSRRGLGREDGWMERWLRG